jgi:uncharacterized protein
LTTRIILEKNVVIPMRDGVATRANVFRRGDAPRVPSVLVRTPYSKDLILGQNTTLDPIRAVESGFAVVVQDVRGRYESDGELAIFDEADDGVDSIEWVAHQPWCNGNVGMTGSSYLGLVQWLAAAQRPASLRTIVPINIGRPPYMHELCYVGGAFKLGYVLWLITQFFAPETARRRAMAGAADSGEVARILAASDDIEGLARWRPLATLPLFRENPVAGWYEEAIREDAASGNDPDALTAHYAAIDTPVLNIGGWYDYFLPGTLTNYSRMRGRGSPASDHQRLLIGPWDHLLNSRTAEYDFGFSASAAAMDLSGYQLQHFDHYLKSRAGEPLLPRVRIFVMGENVWRDEDDWPLARSRPEAWYLKPDGSLSIERPPDGEAPDHFLYDPRNPAPTLGGAVGLPGLVQGINVGPYDQRPLEARPDVLTYTSDVLQRPIEVTGPLRCTLFAATSATDTDWIVRLCDVHPNGASRILAEGVLRARHRSGAANPSPARPGVTERYEIDTGATSNVFLAGHRIRVDVTSSSFPYLEPNPNTGHRLGEDRTEDVIPALQTVFHDAARPSHILLPVVTR